MDSYENGLDNLSKNEISDATNSFYQLLEKQAKQFELFGQRLKSEVQNSYQEVAKLQQEPTQNSQTIDHEITVDYQRNRQIITEITKLSDSRSEVLESLKARVEELETNSIVKNQDIKKLRQDFKNFLELNKSKIKKIDNKGKSVDVANNSKDVIWEVSSCDEGFNWDDDVEHESARAEAAASSSKHLNSQTNQENSQNTINKIHAKVQEAIIRRKNIGKTIKRRNLKCLLRDFTTNDLYQYSRSGKFLSSLNKKAQKIIKELINENKSSLSSHPLSNQENKENQEDQENQENSVIENLHSQVQQLVSQKELLGCRIRLKHLKDLEKCFFTNDFIEYTNTNQFNSLDNNSKRLMNLLIHDILSRDFRGPNLTLSQNIDEYIKRGVIPELPSECNNYTTYGKSEIFNKLNKTLKKRVTKLIQLESRILY